MCGGCTDWFKVLKSASVVEIFVSLRIKQKNFGFWPTICGNSTKKLILKKSNRQKTNDRMSVLACDPNQQGVSMIRVIIWRGILCQLINWAHFVISLIFWGGEFLSP